MSPNNSEKIAYANGRWEIHGRRLAVMDFETDPFKYGRVPAPFVIGIYDGLQYLTHWGADCVKWFIEWLKTEPPTCFYAHNGGNFDFMFLREWWEGTPTIINGRVVKFQIGQHEFRDSFKLMPVALRKLGAKGNIDYDKMERGRRGKNRQEILDYLKPDCLVLYDAIRKFFDLFGVHLTIGGAAIRRLQSLYDYERITFGQDLFLRPFFYGGRNQCFESGILKGKWKIYDVNSMYPFVMATVKHPISGDVFESKTISKRTAFIRLRAKNYGALPSRSENGSLDFTVKEGIFETTIHEYKAGIETGTLEPIEILSCYDFTKWTTFDRFILPLYKSRVQAAKRGDDTYKELYKLLQNNGYGKFAQDYRNFRDYQITKDILPQCQKDCEEHCGSCWELSARIDEDTYLWEKPVIAREYSFHNVATGASITGAARAYLLRALSQAKRPLYCDTDSIMCESLSASVDATKLGSWKLEAQGTVAAIAGKKTYALLDNNQTIKKASKGANLSGEEILAICRGDEIEYAQDAPRFKLDGRAVFTKRRIKATHKGAKNV